ncbi:DUF4974 domain-containing protein [Pseudoflavitalea sp. X16]|uniref:DUF4974 domain-containing protein n=1 Tax=Paraflavitalea devenefica TaxID=2716334 RepID=UPI001422C985|nr:DUF4974 domain-containing protein [Paraflavitalea devenefica]NII26192.1 DUF4974 domain-containing protein [Paraflavitalea devenefica]
MKHALMFNLLFLTCTWQIIAQTYIAPKGQPAMKFILPEGSTLWLQPGSSATFSASLPTGSLALSGSGFLKINHDRTRDHYLTVISHGANRFTLTSNTDVFLSNFPEDRETKISTTKGTLQVRVKDALYRVSDTSALVITNSVRYLGVDRFTNDTAFIKERIVYESRPLFQIINEVGRYFGLSVIYKDTLDCRLHGWLTLRRAKVSDVIKYIRVCDNYLCYTLEGNVLTCYKKETTTQACR